jgi:hypothetical protein
MKLHCGVCKMRILEVCLKTLISLYVSYKRCRLVTTALKFSGCSAKARHLSDSAMLSLNFRLAKICQITFCRRLRKMHTEVVRRQFGAIGGTENKS